MVRQQYPGTPSRRWTHLDLHFSGRTALAEAACAMAFCVVEAGRTW